MMGEFEPSEWYNVRLRVRFLDGEPKFEDGLQFLDRLLSEAIDVDDLQVRQSDELDR